MRWDRLFDDLEAQASAEWEAERAALASESERVRLSRVSLRDRLLVLRDAQAQVRVQLSGGAGVEGRIVAVGADWLAVDRGPSSVSIVPLGGLTGLRMAHADLLHSASGRVGQALRERMDGAAVLATDGADGMALADEDGFHRIAAIRREVADVTGAGDAVAAVLAAVLGGGGELRVAAGLGNAAGAVAVTKRGTAPFSLGELRAVVAGPTAGDG